MKAEDTEIRVAKKLVEYTIKSRSSSFSVLLLKVLVVSELVVILYLLLFRKVVFSGDCWYFSKQLIIELTKIT